VGNRLASLFVPFFVLAVAAVCTGWEGTPQPLPLSAPQDLFSANRALVYLDAFAKVPHPIGTPEHDRVRDYLVSQLTRLGVEPQIQRTTGVTPRYQVAGTIENVVARVKGTSSNTDAVAFVAHYDSVAAGPGAGDDGAGVAALLEMLHALRAGPPLRNDIIILVTDGEEAGLLGASAFVAEHPWSKDVRVALNFDNRGNAGPSQLFETSAGNGRLVAIFARSAPRPIGTSLAYEVYKHMPNDTDMTVFKKSGTGGLNFGFIGDVEAYHTEIDNPQLLDRGSLQHLGENALALARALGNANLSQLQDRDVVYFTVPGNLFLHYPSRLIWPLTIGSGMLLLTLIFYARSAWHVRFLGMFAGFFAYSVTLVLLTLIGLGFVHGVRWLHQRYLPEGPLMQNQFYVLGMLFLLFAAQMALYGLLRKKIAPPAFFLGGALLIFILVLLTSEFLPGGSYLLVWPLLAGLLATVTAAFGPSRQSLPSVSVLCLLSLPALVLLVPTLKNLYIGLGFTPVGAPVLSLSFGLLFILLSPFLDSLLESGCGYLPLGALAVAISLCGVGAWTTRYTTSHPKPSMVAYALDADTGKALWTSSAARMDPWTAQFVGTSPVRAKLKDYYPDWWPLEFLQRDAEAIALLPPQAELLENSIAGDSRTFRIHITSPRHARVIHVGIMQTNVLNASVDGHDLGEPSEARWYQPDHWAFDYANPPTAGFNLQLHVQGTGTVTLVLVDRSSGVPDPFPRPPDSMSFQSGDQTMVRRSFVF